MQGRVIAGVLAATFVSGVCFGMNAQGDPPPPEREVKWIEKPSVPTVITREVPAKTVYVQVQLPESCVALATLADHYMSGANKVNTQYSKFYERLADAKSYIGSDAGRFDNLLEDLARYHDTGEEALYGMFNDASSFQTSIDRCRSDIEDANQGGD